MEVSYRTILRKIEENIHLATNQESPAKMREHIQAIKALCEIILDSGEEMPSTIRPQPITSMTPTTQTLSFSEKKLETDDGANGDSIFDF